MQSSFFEALGYCSYYGTKLDPEPGRCRRNNGKKWRCVKDAYPDSKYCEHHMHRGRNHSRKPVESQSASHSLSTRVTAVSSTGSDNRSYQNLSNGTFQNPHLYPTSNSGTIDFGRNASNLGIKSHEFTQVWRYHTIV
ncbi:putative transcription factor interactor and regulator C3H-WRC/GRF family [Helianthus debilis subsp. tardiflorus]